MKKIIIILVAVIMLGVAVKAILEGKKPPEFHAHADFALFLNGERFDFGKPEFMSIQPCTTDETGWIPATYAHLGEEGLASAVHLHGGVGHIIHVHRPGITARDFFASLDMEFQDDRLIDRKGKETLNNATNNFRFFVNGTETATLATREIQDLDQILITYGRKNRSQEFIDRELAELTDEACIYSGLCPERGQAPPESCGS